ncbi:hypothetical protein [Vibrio sp. 1982]|uniref:hypothetical protein n=1 Tax=Vibrio sp. 1982 TaxID=3074586 RepID=UPI002964467D|nr:hypothetical protein [Vibrio sp. 1982]MDW2216230.1 hypothetical protein [Vibrio sp. 1982]
MLILVIQGTECRERDSVITQLTHLTRPQVVTIDVSFLPTATLRLDRLKVLLHRSPKVLNVVVGANSKEEIAFLREQGAMFFNLHRRFPSHLLDIEGAIHPEDCLVSPTLESEPDVDVYRPDEAFSECFARHKFRRKVA